MKLTKIVATISDNRCSVEFLSRLHCNGMNVVRINSAHTTPESFRKIVTNVRAVSNSIGIMLDTKGPEIRTTAIASPGTPLEFHCGDRVKIVDAAPDEATDALKISLNQPGVINRLTDGCHIIIDDGELDFAVESVDGNVATAVARCDGQLGSRKTVNIPGIIIDLPAVTERDKQFIRLAAELDIDFIAHSFVRTAEDVLQVRKILDECQSTISIIAKIENQQGVDNISSILEACYGIMVARGDLGIEVPAERIPAIQRMLIQKCIAEHKPVIVATQMLHSMIDNPRPTRAEVTDVAEAAYQRADALMLSGETAAGRYPEEAVATMSRIAEEVEHTLAANMVEAPLMADHHITSFLARQAVMSQVRVGTQAIVTDSFHGRAARFIASFRGSKPVFAICNKLNVARRLSLSFGIIPYYYHSYIPAHRYPTEAISDILKQNHLTCDDRIAYLGSLGGVDATFLEISTLSEILTHSGNSPRECASAT